MSDFPWTTEDYNEKKFQEQYQKNVEDCANAILEDLKFYNDDYIMQIFTKDVFAKVRKQMKKIGSWDY